MKVLKSIIRSIGLCLMSATSIILVRVVASIKIVKRYFFIIINNNYKSKNYKFA